jgi:hypothetical protein
LVQKNSEELDLNDTVLLTVEKDKPRTVKQIIQLIQDKHKLPEKEIIEHILDLQSKGKLIFKENPSTTPPTTSREYLFTHYAYWYWTVVALSVATTTLAFIVPENSFPTVYTRYLLGSLFVLFLPGYTFIKALFPAKELDNIERLALSIGMSLALVPITGLLLNYTQWGIRTTPITLSLLALTITFATAAVVREHQFKSQDTRQNT